MWKTKREHKFMDTVRMNGQINKIRIWECPTSFLAQLLAVFRLAQTSEVKVAFIFFSIKKGFKKPNYS